MESFWQAMLVDNMLSTVVTAIASALAGFFICKFTSFTKKERARLDIDICQARETIFDAYEKYVVEGHRISSARYDNLVKLGNAYAALHQNSTAGKYMEEIKALKPYLITD